MSLRSLVLIAPDDLSWAAVRMLLRSMPDVHVLYDATRAQDALEAGDTSTPDAIMSATSLDGEPALPLLLQLRSRWRATPVILLLDHEQHSDLDGFAALGCLSCLSWKDLKPEALTHCVRAALGAPVQIFSTSIAESVPARRGPGPPAAPGAPSLSPRARSVLEGLASGLTEQQLALAEGVSLRTIQRTIAELEARLGAPSLFTLGCTAERLGLLGQASSLAPAAQNGENAPFP